MDLKEKKVITDIVSAVFMDMAKLNRGDTVPTERIEKVSNMARYTGHWSSVIRKLKRRFERERGITLWPEMGVGYRLLTEQEQLTIVPRARQRRSRRQQSMAIVSLEVLPTEGLSLHEQSVRAATIEGLRRSRRVTGRHMREQSILGRRTETIPTGR